MKELTLSNGVTIRANVGDGFDGSSGVYVNQGRAEKGMWGFPVPAKDRKAVIKLLRWYVKEEMKLRRWEGVSWRYLDGGLPAIESECNPYQIMFRIGHLEGWPRSQKHKKLIAQGKPLPKDKW